MKKIILLVLMITVSTQLSFSYSKEMTSLKNKWYSSSNTNDVSSIYSAMEVAINTSTSKVEKQTYKNIAAIIKSRMNLDSKKETYNMLESVLAENEPPLSESNANYMTSVADLMGALIKYSSFSEVIKLAGKSDELYKKALKIEPNNFNALIGYGTFIAFNPKISGGGIDKAMPILQKAEINAKEKWEKQLVYIWISQAYMKMDDENNYKKYMTLAKNIFPNGVFFNMVKSKNEENKYLFGK